MPVTWTLLAVAATDARCRPLDDPTVHWLAKGLRVDDRPCMASPKEIRDLRSEWTEIVGHPNPQPRRLGLHDRSPAVTYYSVTQALQYSVKSHRENGRSSCDFFLIASRISPRVRLSTLREVDVALASAVVETQAGAQCLSRR
jgi:hypothetical protein